jgi:hypothetical protein
MARRVGTLLVGSAVLALCGSLSGCYAHHTADEELVDIPFPAAYDDDDAGTVVSDGGAAKPRCTGADALANFLCNLTSPAPTAQTPAAAPDLTDLITAAGSLGDLAGLFGGGATGNTGNAANPFADLLAGLGIPASAMGGTGTTTPTNPFMRPDAGTTPRPVTMPTAQDCVAPTSPITQFICSLQPGGTTTTTTTSDAGTPVIGI